MTMYHFQTVKLPIAFAACTYLPITKEYEDKQVATDLYEAMCEVRTDASSPTSGGGGLQAGVRG
jgi:hypothetical protein